MEALGQADIRGNQRSRVHEINMLLVIAFCIGFTAVSQRRRAGGVGGHKENERKLQREALVRKTRQYS